MIMMIVMTIMHDDSDITHTLNGLQEWHMTLPQHLQWWGRRKTPNDVQQIIQLIDDNYNDNDYNDNDYNDNDYNDNDYNDNDYNDNDYNDNDYDDNDSEEELNEEEDVYIYIHRWHLQIIIYFCSRFYTW